MVSKARYTALGGGVASRSVATVLLSAGELLSLTDMLVAVGWGLAQSDL